MSFASDTKNEISKSELSADCCKKAEAYGLLLFTRLFSLQEGNAVTENGAVARLMAEKAAEAAGVFVETSVSVSRKGGGCRYPHHSRREPAPAAAGSFWT